MADSPGMNNPNLDDPQVSPKAAAQYAAEVFAQSTGIAQFDVAVVLGSGWSSAPSYLGETVASVPAAAVPGFATSAVSGHLSSLQAVRFRHASGQERHALIIGARTHLYEGLGVRRVAHGMRTAAALQARTVMLTNGAGSINPQWAPGTPVLISDHINLTGQTALRGADFVDLTNLYSPRIRAIAKEIDSDLPEGVYAQFPGPQYETPAEVRMARTLGADLVGMSTAIEAVAARAAGLEVFGISLATNLAAGVSDKPLAHAEVLEAGINAQTRIGKLLAEIIRAS